MGKHTRTAARSHDDRPEWLGELIHAAVRRAIEVAVDEELTAALGARPYERDGDRGGYRNGTKARTLTGPTGPLALTVPRARLFTPTGRRNGPRPCCRATAPAAGGQRGRGRHLSRRWEYATAPGCPQPLAQGGATSKSAVSRIIGTLKVELEAWRTRSLTDLDVLGLYLDALALRVRSAGKVVSVPVLGVVAVLTDGQKQLVALELCPGGETFAAWKGCLDDLVARGLEALVWAVIDGHAGLRKAVGLVWPPAVVQRCCVHKLRNLERKAPKHALAGSGPTSTASSTPRPRRPRTPPTPPSSGSGRPLPRSRPQPAGGWRGAAHVLPIPEAAVEDVAHHECH